MSEPYAGQPAQSASTDTAIGLLPRALLASPATIVAIAIILSTALVVAPILAFPLPPLEDYPNHLARMHVIATIGSDPDLSRYYEVHWQIIPNLIMDIIVPVLA